MQNKPNFQKVKMNVSDYITREYGKKDTWWSGKNKPNSNPIQTQTNPISEEPKMNVKSILAVDYENIAINIEDPAFRGRNTNPKQTQFQRGNHHKKREL